MTTSSKRLSHFQEYFFSKANAAIAATEMETGKKVINLGIGSPDLPPDPSVITVMKKELDHPLNHRYPPYNGEPVLRIAISQYYKKRFKVILDPEGEILPLIGSKEGLVHACLAFVNPDDKVLVPDPGYPAYTAGPIFAGGAVQLYTLEPKNHWLPNLKAIERMNLSKTKVWWIGYPNNPTGAVASLNTMKKWVAFAKKHDLLIFYDNPYADVFFGSEKPHSILEVSGAKEHAIEFNSLSKSHNLAGWRVGMVSGKKEHIQAILKVKSNIDTGIFLPIQKAAAFALDRTTASWINARNRIYKKRRDVMCKALTRVGFKFEVPQASLYIWAQSPFGNRKVEDVAFELIEKCHVFITPGTAFGPSGEGYFRISLCQTEELIAEAGRRLEKYLWGVLR